MVSALMSRTGAAAVVEWVEGVRNVHENHIGVATNSPPFDWHMINLRNYVNQTAMDVPTLSLSGETVAPLGQGTGMLGLPGDFTPPSRFVRAAAFAVPRPHEVRIAREAFGRGEILHPAVAPQAADAAKRRQAAFGRNAGTGQHTHGMSGREPLGEILHVPRVPASRPPHLYPILTKRPSERPSGRARPTLDKAR